MTYLSGSDRRAERESAEDRLAGPAQDWAESVLPGLRRCMWCRQSVSRHSPEALSRCEAAFQAERNRQLSGPLRIADVAGRLA